MKIKQVDVTQYVQFGQEQEKRFTSKRYEIEPRELPGLGPGVVITQTTSGLSRFVPAAQVAWVEAEWPAPVTRAVRSAKLEPVA